MHAVTDTPPNPAPEEFAPAPPAGLARHLALAVVVPSKTNPRRAMDPKALAELTDSIRRHGLLQPILVRPIPPRGEGQEVELFELVAGHRRHEAARAAGLEYVPATVRTLTDPEVLEIQLVENLQRSDLHPLEEAEGYRQLTAVAKYDVTRIAERIGRSVKYVYDRLKLLALTKEAKQAFLEDRITAGHAILLARLLPADQDRALAPDSQAVFVREAALLLPEEEDDAPRLKPRSVRELQAWIDQHVRFDAKAPDPMLFPETAGRLEEAKKFVSITFGHHVHPDARDGRTYIERSWKRADGEKGSTPCEHAVLGVVAAGPGRGDAFDVCVKKDRCEIHWGKELRAKAKREKARGENGPGTSERSVATRAAEEKKRQALDRAYAEAIDAIRQAVGEAAAKVSPERLLRCLVLVRPQDVRDYLRDFPQTEIGSGAGEETIRKWVAKAPQAQIQRIIADMEVVGGSDDDIARELGIDPKAILERSKKKALAALKAEVSPAPKDVPAKPKATTRPKAAAKAARRKPAKKGKRR